MDYIRQTLNAGRVFICFDEDELDYGREIEPEGINEEEVTVDPNNCVKVWTFYNDDEDDYDFSLDRKPYIFATQEDANDWLEVANGDGHANCPYHWCVVTDGVEVHYDEDN